MSEPKGKYFNPEKAEKLAAYNAQVEALLEAIAAGDEDTIAELKDSVKASQAELKSSGRGAHTLLKVTGEEFLELEPKEGEALVMVKTIAGTECRKINPKVNLKYRRVSVSIEDIWAYSEKKEEAETESE